MSTADVNELDRLDPRDRAYAEGVEDRDERARIVSTLLRYRQPERLQEGERVPPLELLRLDDARTIRVDELLDRRPLVLVFGSFT
jgi:hypothetical protein